MIVYVFKKARLDEKATYLTRKVVLAKEPEQIVYLTSFRDEMFSKIDVLRKQLRYNEVAWILVLDFDLSDIGLLPTFVPVDEMAYFDDENDFYFYLNTFDECWSVFATHFRGLGRKEVQKNE